MKTRNWHRRNLAAAQEVDTTATVCSGGDAFVFVQIRLKSDLGNLNLTMTPAETRDLIAQLTHCVSRYGG